MRSSTQGLAGRSKLADDAEVRLGDRGAVGDKFPGLKVPGTESPGFCSFFIWFRPAKFAKKRAVT